MNRPQSHNKLNIPKASSEVEAANKGYTDSDRAATISLIYHKSVYSYLRNNYGANHVSVRDLKKYPVIDVLYFHYLGLIHHVAHELAIPLATTP